MKDPQLDLLPGVAAWAELAKSVDSLNLPPDIIEQMTKAQAVVAAELEMERAAALHSAYIAERKRSAPLFHNDFICTTYSPVPEKSVPATESTPTTVGEIAPSAMPPCAKANTHKIGTRANILNSVIEQAKLAASNPGDYQSVYAELVKLADSPSRPAPLLGYSEGEGVKYQDYNGIKFFNKRALKKRMERNA